MDSQMVFKRYELKYILTREQKQKICDAMAPHMEADSFGRSTIRNIYYDTDDFRIIRKSLEHPVYKEKLRMRSYRTAGPDDKVFAELKKKYDGVVYKRRESLNRQEAENFIATGKIMGEPTQIIREIKYFLDFYGNIGPKVFISYEREAFYDVKNRNFRLTFDENILWRREDLSLGKGIYGEPALDRSLTLMEIKTASGIPLWLAETMSREKIFRTTFSKYGTAYMQILKNRKGEQKYA
ncbi:MAG: polyphosphate polymerase domain-containing protein [Butyrivibrio sp.]